MRGQSVLVEGREYFVGDNGLCVDIPEEHARRLLDQTAAWVLVHPSDITRPDTTGRISRTQPDDIVPLSLPTGEALRLPEAAPLTPAPRARRGRPPKKSTE